MLLSFLNSYLILMYLMLMLLHIAIFYFLFFTSCRSLSNMCYCNAIKSIWIPLRSLFASLCMHTVFIHNAAQHKKKREKIIYYETRKNNHKEPWSNKRKSGTMLFVGLIDRQCTYCFELVVKKFLFLLWIFFISRNI